MLLNLIIVMKGVYRLKLFTMQNISVLDLLKQGKIYRADYTKIFDKDYLRQYKFLAH